jgi:nucleotide-binding universal stress UspA family protein
MLKVLVPVDGSENALRALSHVVATKEWYREPLDVHVLNVQRRVASGAVRMFVSQDVLHDYYREEGEAALKGARAMLAGSDVPHHQCHVAVGDEAECIAQYARDEGCKLIVMGTRGLGRFGNLLLGSVATSVIHLAEVPVTLIK